MTVAIVAACPFPGKRGTPVRILRSSEALASRGHHVHVVSYHLGSGEVDERISVHRTPRVATYRKYSPGPTYQKLFVLDPLLAIRLRGLLRREAVDVIHAHHFEGLAVAAAARIGTDVPVVFDAHTLLGSELAYYPMGLPSGLLEAIGRTLDRRLPRRADHVVAVTETIRRRLIASGAVTPDRATVVPNGVELEPFDGHSSRRERERDAPPVVVYTGNLAPYQGIDLLLRAFRRVVETRPDARLRIVADPDSSFDRYAGLARRLRVGSNIELVRTGFSEVPGLLASADVAVNPRVDCEGAPLKVMNYMAAAKPVVSFESSARDLRHRETGWVVPDRETDAFGRAILSLLDEPEVAREMGAAAREFVENHRSWHSLAGTIEGIYRQLLPATGATPEDSR